MGGILRIYNTSILNIFKIVFYVLYAILRIICYFTYLCIIRIIRIAARLGLGLHIIQSRVAPYKPFWAMYGVRTCTVCTYMYVQTLYEARDRVPQTRYRTVPRRREASLMGFHPS